MSAEQQRTPDGRHIVVGGRRWRASDPAIPEPLRQQLVDELMAARRAVKAAADDDAIAAARARVQDAKVALGERGEPWWEAPTTEGRATRLSATIRALLRGRAPDATICPSDAARASTGDGWRDVMQVTRDIAADLAAQGQVEVRQGGEPVDPAEARGPVRIGRGPDFPSPTDP